MRVAALLKERDVPRIITGIVNLPIHEDDAYDTRENAAKSQNRRSTVLHPTGSGSMYAPCRSTPGRAFGLPRESAERDTYPAQIGRCRSPGHH